MDIPLEVNVICGNEVCGLSKVLIINPVNDQVTHIVVSEKEFPYIEHLVPLELISESTPTSIHLRCPKTELPKMELFVKTDFISAGEVNFTLPYEEPYMLWPYSWYDQEPIPVEQRNIPLDRIAIHRGSIVKAIDGKVGKVDEFLVNPENGRISHLVMRECHLWGAKDVTIPVLEIDRIAEDTVILKLNKQAISKLPAVSVHRNWE